MQKCLVIVVFIITMGSISRTVVARTSEGVEATAWAKVKAQLEAQGVHPPGKAGWDIPTEAAKLLPTANADGDQGNFGRSVAIDGDTMVVGANDDDKGGEAGAAYVFGRDVGGTDTWGQITKLLASDGATEDFFGISVSISGNTIVVGAKFDDDNGSDSGSAYVFDRNMGGPDTWGQIAKLVAPDGAANDLFGSSVAISGDTVAVGASDDFDQGARSGSAYVFGRDVGGTDSWGQVRKLLPSNGSEISNFGYSVAISGNTVVVGADSCGTGNLGAAFVFGQNVGGSDMWGQVTKLVSTGGQPNDYFGFSVGISGDILVVGALFDDENGPQSGSAYLFGRDAGGPNVWGQVAKITASDGTSGDEFGWSVGISGNTVVIGSRSDDDNGQNSGSTYVFEKDVGGPNTWDQVAKLLASAGATGDSFGSTVGISGDTVGVGAVFDKNHGGVGAWGETKEIVGPAVMTARWDSFGYSVAMDGERIVIGATEVNTNYGSGSAYLFGRNQGGPNEWGLITRLVASDGMRHDSFGSSVSISGDFVVVGARASGSDSGSAYIFSRNQGGSDTWGQVARLTASDPTNYGYFGWSVGIFGDTVVVGALDDSSGASAGTVYLFLRDLGGPDAWGQATKITASDGGNGDNFGVSVGISGDTVVVGAFTDDDNGSDSGSAYVFDRNQGGTGAWGQVTKITASDGSSYDMFGLSVGISNDTIVVGAYRDSDQGSNSGSAYVFDRNQGGTDAWGQVTKITASDGSIADEFGRSISINGDTVVVGAPLDDDGGPNSGSAYVFGRDQDGLDAWGQVTKITASNAAEHDHFGSSVCVFGDTSIVGAFLNDDLGLGSGSATVFQGPVNPKILTVHVTPYSSDNVLSYGEWVPVQITDFSVVFSEPMADPAGNSDPNDVTNPSNWLLVGTGPDGLVQTSSCTAGLSGDDTQMVLDNIVYTDTQLTLDFRANGGSALGEGSYTLFACASLESAGGEVLDGDGDGAGRDDFVLPFGIDLTVPSNPLLSSPSHSINVWTADNSVDLSWSGAADDGSGVAGYSIEMDSTADTEPDGTVDIAHSTDPNGITLGPLTDGDNWYFHLRTCDVAGNCASGEHLGPFWIDSTGPEAVTNLISTSHAVGVPSNDVTIDAEWEAANDVLNGVEGYAVEFSNSATWVCDGILDIIGTTASSQDLGDNSWYVHVCAVDTVGNWGAVTSAGPFVVEATVPEVKFVGSEGGTIDGLLTENESALAAVSQLMVNFSEPMFNPAGNETPGDLTNPDSFRVLNLGPDGILTTVDCTSTLGGDDLGVFQGGELFAWNSDQNVSILGLASKGLTSGHYALMICELQDLAGHEMVGPWIRSFSISANNVLLDPNFDDGSLSAWDTVSPDSGDIVWADADPSNPASGVVVFDPVVNAEGETFEITQCLDVVGGMPSVLGVLSRIDSSSQDAPTLKAMVRYFRNADCSNQLQTTEVPLAQGDTAGVWRAKRYLPSRPPTEALSARVAFVVDGGTAMDFTVVIDEAVFFEETIFIDGFEQATTNAWSNTVSDETCANRYHKLELVPRVLLRQ